MSNAAKGNLAPLQDVPLSDGEVMSGADFDALIKSNAQQKSSVIGLVAATIWAANDSNFR